ncbi:MAG: ATP-binding cassette domain-containing protein, partial [Eubacterium sp.]|nr:ATP-binding cassette domain-containing protein [Eubacterium sp.]
MALLKAEHVTKQYGGRTIIKDINIELHRGELVSLLGVSGSGKTTLFHVLSGLIAPEEGKVLLEGEDITAQPGKISYMMQKDLLLPHKKIIDNVSLPLVLHGTKKKEAREKADPLFEEFGLDGTQYQYPCQLSGGMRQRAA